MALSKQTIAIIASRRSATKSAANDDAPKAPRARLALPNFVDTLFAEEMTIGTTSTDGKPFLTMKGCAVTLASGTPAVRTVMAFDDAYDAVRAAIHAGQDVVATLAHTGGTLKVVGLQVDGEMKMFDQAKPLPKAA
jgi:hypothetical protein